MTTDTERTTAAEARNAFLAGLTGLEYRAVFVPQSASRNASEKQPTLNWRLTLARKGVTLNMEYTQGIGHLEGYNARAARSMAGDAVIRKIVETGKVPVGFKTDPYSEGFSSRPLPVPPLADVLYSLLGDADVLNYGTYEEWAPELGYDTDSRKGEALWHECRKIGNQFRRLFTTAEYETLRQHFEGY